MRHRDPELSPDTVRHTRLVLVALAAGTVTFGVWLFIWAWQLESPVLIVFGVVCLPMGIVLVYGAVLACQGSDAPKAAQILSERRHLRPGWASHTPRHVTRYQPKRAAPKT